MCCSRRRSRSFALARSVGLPLLAMACGSGGQPRGAAAERNPDPDWVLRVATAELHDRDGSGTASVGDEVLLLLRRPLPPWREPNLDAVPLASPDDSWGRGATLRFYAPGRRGRIYVVLGENPRLTLYETYAPGEASATISQIRSPEGPIPILVAEGDRRSFVGGRYALTDSMRPYFGQLHSHSGFSDGVLEPADAFGAAREWGHDFFAVTDHLEQLDDGEWRRGLEQARAATQTGFVALYGYEWGGFPTPSGWMNHVNVLGSDERLSLVGTLWLRGLYDGLLGLPGDPVVAQFNHPGMNRPGISGRNNWDEFNYAPDADLRLSLMMVDTGVFVHDEDNSETTGLIPALDRGWHVGPKGEEDNHQADWGRTRRRTGVWLESLDRRRLLEGLARMATFYSDDADAHIRLIGDGEWLMGSTLYGAGPHRLTVEIGHRTRSAEVTRLEIVSFGGTVVASHEGGLVPLRATFEVDPANDTYYFARVLLELPELRLISAPLFVDR